MRPVPLLLPRRASKAVALPSSSAGPPRSPPPPPSGAPLLRRRLAAFPSTVGPAALLVAGPPRSPLPPPAALPSSVVGPPRSPPAPSARHAQEQRWRRRSGGRIRRWAGARRRAMGAPSGVPRPKGAQSGGPRDAPSGGVGSFGGAVQRSSLPRPLRRCCAASFRGGTGEAR
jgi:hypothetical protein